MRIIWLVFSAAVVCGAIPAEAADNRSTKQLIYDDCMPVHAYQYKIKHQNENPDEEGVMIYAHLVCKVISSSCEQDQSQCKKIIASYDHDRGESGPSELYKAAGKGDSQLVKKLLKIGFDPNAPLGGPGWSPLMAAAAENHKMAVTALINGGADVNARNKLGRTALMFASNNGFASIVKELLKAGADPNLVPDDDQGMPALLAAASGGHAKVVEILMTNGADGSATDKQGRTAFSLANNAGHKEVLKILEKHGVSK
ncbi:MAG TPA: ankyrin repeat domain-containing protein [Mariprofundaceae bacterium]|nr:ankyrin repeat domain-containing protein [Mariprofundaceae bacterium]